MSGKAASGRRATGLPASAPTRAATSGPTSAASSIESLAAAAASSSRAGNAKQEMPRASSSRPQQTVATSNPADTIASENAAYTEWQNRDGERPTIWQAPQSRLFPTGGYSFRPGGNLAPTDDPVKLQRRRDTYFRRVALPHSEAGPRPTKFQTRSQIAAFTFSAGVVIWATLFHDFGPDDHVFRGLRQWVGVEKNTFTLSEDEKVWATGKGLLDGVLAKAGKNGTDDDADKPRLV